MDKSRHRVVIGINSLIFGGAQKLVIQQLNFFNQEKYEIHLIVLSDFKNTNDFKYLIPNYVKFHQLSFKRFCDFKNWIKLFKILRTIKPDVVISHLFFSNTIFRILKLFGRYPIFVVEHNTYVNKSKSKVLVDKILSVITKKIIAVSEEVADFSSRHYKIKRDKFIVIPNGIDLSEIKKKKEGLDKKVIMQELGIDEDQKIILHVGRLAKQKNQKLLIEGFNHFALKNKNWKLLIIGGGDLQDNLEKLVIDLNASERIKILGPKNNVHPYYFISQCFLSTSFIEGMSITHLEALAYGLPIITTKTGGTSALIKENQNGFFIDKYTKESVAESLNKFTKSNLKKLREDSLRTVQDFDIAKTVETYEKLFEKCIKD